jgi:hypothetical protein
MSKQIRPLVAFKKAYPELYDNLTDKDNPGLSKKAQENEFYWNYVYHFLGVEPYKDILDPAQIEIIEGYKEKHNPTKDNLQKFINDIKKATYHLTKTEFNSFFLTSWDKKNNKLTITEIGRLLLTGWYYNVEDWTKEVGLYIYKAYEKKVKEEKGFNDLEIYKVVNHIRENIGYYYHNQIEAKYYLLDKLFNKDLKKLLPPPPEKIKEYERIVSYISEIRKNQKKKGVDYWIDKAEDLESYNIYLQDILEEIGVVNYLSFEDWEKEKKQENEEYFKELNVIREEYKKSILNDIKKLLLE